MGYAICAVGFGGLGAERRLPTDEGGKVRKVGVALAVSGSFASLRMTATTRNDNENDKGNGNARATAPARAKAKYGGSSLRSE
jgi:hypothetical protein